MSARDAAYYDLEGPISSQDHAQAVCKRFIPDGDKLFAALSRYDDILTLTDREGYEPGDTLMLLTPFLIEAGVTEEDLKAVSTEAGLVPGICELFNELQNEGCLVWIISTSYEQHALSIAQRAGVPDWQVSCTKFPLDQFRNQTAKEDFSLIRKARKKAVKLYHNKLESGVNDKPIQELLDPFFWKRLPKAKFGQVMAKVEVMGGRRKLKTLEDEIRERGIYLSDIFTVVDSITDFRMAQAVEAGGGIALVWNGNRFIIPYATCGVAAVDARAVKPIFQAWRDGGRKAVREIVESIPEPENPETGPHYHWLAGREKDDVFQEEVLAIHKRLRTVCRGVEVAKLS